MSELDSAGIRRLGALHSLPELFEAIEAAVDSDEVLALALDALSIALPTERVAIVLFEADGTRRSRSRRLSEASSAAFESAALDVAAGATSRLVPDLEHDATLGAGAADLIADGVRSIGLFALSRRGRALGRVAAAFERPRDFADSECAAALAIAHAASASIERRAQGAPAERVSSADPETRFRMLLEAAPDPIVATDETGRIHWINSQTERSFGWSRDELVGQPIEKLIPEGVHDVPPHRGADSAEARSMGIDLEPHALRKDGIEVPVEISLSTTPSEAGLLVTAIVRDVSDRVQLEEERASLIRQQIGQVEAEKSRQRSVFLAEATRVLTSSLDVGSNLAKLARLTVPLLADGCVVDLVSEDGSIQRVATAHVDAAKEPLLRDLLKHESPPAIPCGSGPAFEEAPASDEPRETALHAYLPDPDQVRLIRDIGSVMVMPLVAHERTLGMLTCFRARSGAYDPADLEFAQDLASRTATALENARRYEQAVEANRLKDAFLATLSHELRTPLNAILGWAHLLESGQLDAAKTGQAIDTIQRNAKIQSQLIGDILDFSRITVGHLRLHVSRVRLDGVLDALLAEARPLAEVRGVRLDATIERGATVFGDPARIAQIVRHLLSNAIKFSDRGGFVHLDARREGASATIVVRDQGVGIAPELLPHVFDRFRPADASITRRRGGLGLGLAIARHLVELHGGRLAADSEGEGRGASFTMVLPIRSAATGGLALVGSGIGEPESAPDLLDLSDLRVVAVDDESDVRHLLETLLENRGARVWTASSVREALALIPAVLPDVLLVDIGMAEEDGYSLVRQLRARPIEEGGGTPAIALTAFAREEDRRRALEAGCQLHVAKPVEPDLLLRAIGQVVAEDRMALDPARPGRLRRSRGV